MEQQTYEKRGYLREDFRLFHLSGAMDEPVDWHYHTFHKIILFLSGRAAYGIEGKSYPLESGDLIVVPSGCIHRPEAEPNAPYERRILYLSPEFLRRAPYERVIVYISPEFLRAAGAPGCDLESCFTQARMQFRFVLRHGAGRRSFTAALSALEQEQGGQHFGSELMARALFLQFLIGVSRGMAGIRLLLRLRRKNRRDLAVSLPPPDRGAAHRRSCGALLHQQVPHDAPVQGGDRLHHPQLRRDEAAHARA